MRLLLPTYVAPYDNKNFDKNNLYKNADHFGLKWNKFVFVDDRK